MSSVKKKNKSPCSKDVAYLSNRTSNLLLHKPAFHNHAGLDEELLAFVPQPVHALILLFPITPKYETYVQQEKERIDKQGQTVSPNIVFYPQTIANACGTMGVLHSIANNWAHGGHLKLGKGVLLSEFNLK